MRKETSNQFTEGLVSDLNPITTPNTVLTDNLNGTIITYNGNEFSLQNDQGNYELKHCRLKPNYIPVGIKEHGDILYIVSYNPLDKHVEIGSYPSPLMITTPNENALSNNEIRSIIKSQIIDKGKFEEKYTNLIYYSDSIIFNGDDYKLNPGDEYCIQIQEANPIYKYETIKYSILDEESNPHDITDLIDIDRSNEDEDFSYVKWTIPGWLMINARLAELSMAGINVRYFYISENNINFSFNLRLNIQDDFLIKNGILDEWCNNITNKNVLNDIKFRIKIYSKNQTYIKRDCSINEFLNEELSLEESGWTEWYKDSKIIWKTISGSININDSQEEIIVEVTPILYEKINNEEYQIEYDNLTQKLTFDLKSIDDTEWNIGTNLYQFTSSDTDVKIYTNIDGPKITDAIIDLEYEIFNLHGETITKGKFENYFGIGENVLNIKYDFKFKKENIYIARYTFKSKNKVYNTIDRFLITSELLNGFTDRLIFDKDIMFHEWISKYWSIVPNIKLTEQDFSLIQNSEEKFDNTEDNSHLKTDRDKIYFKGNKYNTFHPYPHSGLSETIQIKKGYKYRYELNKEIIFNKLYGDLWTSLEPIVKFQYKNNNVISDLDTSSINIYKYLQKDLSFSEYGSPFKYGNMNIGTFVNELEYSCELYIGVSGEDETFYYFYIFKKGDLEIEKSEIINSKNKIYDISGEIQTFLWKNNLSFIKLNVYFTETNESRSYHLSNRMVTSNTALMGTANVDLKHSMGKYIFNGIDGDSETLSFVACITRHEININETSPLEGHVTLIPLSNNDNSDSIYASLLKDLFYIDFDGDLAIYSRYILNGSGWIDKKAELEIYASGEFKNSGYNGINILEISDKLRKLFTLSKLQIKPVHANIFMGNEFVNYVSLPILNIEFNIALDNNKYPYVSENSIYEEDIVLSKLTINVESDYTSWLEILERILQRNKIRGVYSKHNSELDVIIENLNKNYNDLGEIKLSPYYFKKVDEWAEETLGIITKTQFLWAAGRTSNRDIKSEQLQEDKGIIKYGSVFKDYKLILEDKWSWLKDEI